MTTASASAVDWWDPAQGWAALVAIATAIAMFIRSKIRGARKQGTLHRIQIEHSVRLDKQETKIDMLIEGQARMDGKLDMLLAHCPGCAHNPKGWGR